MILDFNYSYHPSCVWGAWLCPLPQQSAWLDLSIEAGERKHRAQG